MTSQTPLHALASFKDAASEVLLGGNPIDKDVAQALAALEGAPSLTALDLRL